MKLLLSITLLLISTGVFSQSSGIIRTVGASSDTNFVRNVYERNDSLFQLLNGYEIHIGMLGGSGNGIYSGSGTLSGNTTVDGDGNSLSFTNNDKVVIEGLDSVQIKGAKSGSLSDTTLKVVMVASNGTVYKASATGVVYDTLHFTIASGGGYDTVKLKNTPPKEYIAILTQEGTDAPVATVIKDDFGDITFFYSGSGLYYAESAGAQFTAGKTKVEISNNIMFDGAESWFIQSQIASSSEIGIETGKVGSSLSDGVLGQILALSTSGLIQNIITITVYP